MIDHPKSQLEEVYSNMVKMIEAYGGKVPGPNEPDSLRLISDFCFTLGVEPVFNLRAISDQTATEPLNDRV